MTLVTLYVSMEICRALSTEFMYALSPNRNPPMHASLVLLLTESLKLLVSLFFLVKSKSLVNISNLHMFVAHSFLYFINNSLYFHAFKFANAGTIQFLMHMRLPLTAILHHFLLKRQYDFKLWMCLVVLFIGVVLTQLTKDFQLGNLQVFVLALQISVNSAMAAVYNEKLLKTLKMDFWQQQLCVYSLGFMWSGMYAALTESPLVNSHSSTSSVIFTCLVIIFSGLSGLSVGFLVKNLDNIVKLISNAIATIVVSVVVLVVFGKGDIWIPYFITGALLVLGSTGYYASRSRVATGIPVVWISNSLVFKIICFIILVELAAIKATL